MAFKDKELQKTKSNVHLVVEEKQQKSCLSSYSTNVREGSPNLSKVTKGHWRWYMYHIAYWKLDCWDKSCQNCKKGTLL